MAGSKEYSLAGESGAVYNGMRDTDGGIWLRIRDEDDRRILGAAIDKQKKNQIASIGTLSALDPNAGHLTDYVGTALDRILEGINGARPSSAQLDGTPMGAEIAKSDTGQAGPPAATDGKGKGRKGRGGKGSTVGEVLAQVDGGPLSTARAAAATAGIEWAASVPIPRPAIGEKLRAPGVVSPYTITNVIGFNPETRGFRVVDSSGWDGEVTPGTLGEWRIVSKLLEYTDADDAAANMIATGSTSAPPSSAPPSSTDAGEDFPAGALDETDTAADADTDDTADGDEPADPTPPVPRQRARNAETNGVRRAEPVKKAAKKAAPPARPGQKKRR